MNWVEEAFEEVKEDMEHFWKMNPDFSNEEIEEVIRETRKELRTLDKDKEKIMWRVDVDPQIKTDLEQCWEEAKGADPLSDEELDKIIKEVRREILNEKIR